MTASKLSTPAERAEFQRKFPRAVWDDDAQGYTESMYTYAMVGWLAARRALNTSDAVASITRAAEYLEHYVKYLYEVKPEDIERHPYIPSIEEAAEDLRALVGDEAKPCA